MGMSYDATKTDVDLNAELPCYSDMVLLLFGGLFGWVSDFRGEEPGVPWAYVIAMPALRFLGETGILYAAGLQTLNDTLRIEYEQGREPRRMGRVRDWDDYRGEDVVVARCAKNATTSARFTNTEDDIVHVNG